MHTLPRWLSLPALLLAAFVAGSLSLLAGCDAADPDASSPITAPGPLASAAKSDKSDVCHYDADAGTYALINVATAALLAHLAHGDARPGEAVPTLPGYDFDEACVPELRVLLQQLSLITATYETYVLTGSGAGDVTGNVVVVDINLNEDWFNNSGCEAADFAGFPVGSIALIQRGTCNFDVKALNAEAAGASAVVIFNQGTPGRTDPFGGTLGGTVVGIPVVTASFDAGMALSEPGSTARVLVGL